MIISTLVQIPIELQILIFLFASPFVYAFIFVHYMKKKKEQYEKRAAKEAARERYEQALHELLEWKKEHPKMEALSHSRGRDVYFAYIFAFNQYRQYDPFFRDARAPSRPNISLHQ